MTAEWIFWGCAAGLVHSYLLFPWLLEILAKRTSGNTACYSRSESLPCIYVLMAVHNEEQVIREKTESIFNTDYPPDKIKAYIGSDASTDRTDAFLMNLEKKYPSLHYIRADERSGKGNMLNKLAGLAAKDKEYSRDAILLLTDASVFLMPSTLFELVKHFKNPETGLVDSNMQSRPSRADGISRQEQAYISREVRIKQLEGILWGTMMGPFGGCYALRAGYYTPVPPDFIVDDFFISMNVIRKGKKCINEPAAICHENISNSLGEEFRRKSRISAGNFQNLVAFSPVLLRPFSAAAFCFFSHKVLRWIGPFLIIGSWAGSLLASGITGKDPANQFYYSLFRIQSLLLTVPVLDLLLGKSGINFVTLRFITHFYIMNAALLAGFFRFFRGVKDNVWEPTKREQQPAEHR